MSKPNSDAAIAPPGTGTYMCPEAFGYLCREAFESSTGMARIPSSLLRARLPEALRLCEAHHRAEGLTDDNDIEPYLHAFRSFVAEAEEIEAETGRSVVVGVLRNAAAD